VAILSDPGAPSSDVAEAAASRVRSRGGTARIIEVTTSLDAATLAVELSRAGVDTLLILVTPARALPILQAAAATAWRPRLLLPGSMATSAVFATPTPLEPGLVLAFSSLLPLGPRALQGDYRRLSTRHGLPRDHLQEQLSALASAAVLAETLKRAGRDVHRDSLVDQLERLGEFPSPFSPPVTFHPSRHVGVRGAFLVGVQCASRTFERRTGWSEPED
jgi:ABC-type branched-subunit amino acid transport system substrate-binding protein